MKTLVRPAVLPLLLGLVLVACGGEETAPTGGGRAGGGSASETAGENGGGGGGRRSSRRRSGPEPEVTIAEAPDAAAGAPASVTGRVAFDGEAPERKPLAMGGQAGCEHPKGEVPLSETVIVVDGKLQNAFVWVEEGIDDWPEPAAGDAVVRQKGCVYRPHVAGVRVGQKLRVTNDDPASHNVNVKSKYKDFPNRTQPAGGKDLEFVFERPEIGVLFACNIHPWMKSYVCAVDHPFFAVTGPAGSFALDGLPPGEYTVAVWHEKYGEQTADLVLAPGSRADVTFTYRP